MLNDLAAAMDQLEERFTVWARGKRDIRAAIIVGSRARTDHPADEWADLDVAFMTTSPASYQGQTRWLSEIAPVWTHYRDPSGVTQHVLFEGGLDAGIAVIPARAVIMATRIVPMLRRLPFSFGLRERLAREVQSFAEYYSRGVRVLFDKDGTAERFLAIFAAAVQARPMPSAREFSGAVDEFWFGAVWTAKHLWRGEVWRARSNGIEGRMRDILLQMMEWHARAKYGPQRDTWRDGQFLEEWADAPALARLRESFAGYDAAALESALSAMIQTFAWLSEETAELLRIEYSSEMVDLVSGWISSRREGGR